MPKTEIITIQRTIIMYLPSLPFILRFLNLRESKGILLTISPERDNDNIINEMGDVINEARKSDPE